MMSSDRWNELQQRRMIEEGNNRVVPLDTDPEEINEEAYNTAIKHNKCTFYTNVFTICFLSLFVFLRWENVKQIIDAEPLL